MCAENLQKLHPLKPNVAYIKCKQSDRMLCSIAMHVHCVQRTGSKLLLCQRASLSNCTVVLCNQCTSLCNHGVVLCNHCTSLCNHGVVLCNHCTSLCNHSDVVCLVVFFNGNPTTLALAVCEQSCRSNQSPGLGGSPLLPPLQDMSHLFLTSSLDWTVKLWSMKLQAEQQIAVSGVCASRLVYPLLPYLLPPPPLIEQRGSPSVFLQHVCRLRV